MVVIKYDQLLGVEIATLTSWVSPIGLLWLHDDVYVGWAPTNGLSLRAWEITQSKYGFMDELSKWGEQAEERQTVKNRMDGTIGEKVRWGDRMIMTQRRVGVTGSSLSAHLLLSTCSLIDWVQTLGVGFFCWFSTVYFWKTAQQCKHHLHDITPSKMKDAST